MAQFLGAGSDQWLNALMRSSADHKKRIAEFRSALLQGLYAVGVFTEQISFVGNNNLPALCELFTVFPQFGIDFFKILQRVSAL